MTSIFDSLGEFKDNFLAKAGEIIDSILSIPQKVRDFMEELFDKFFVPDEELMAQRIDSLRSRFGFVDQLMTDANYLKDFLSSASGAVPPTISINLGSYAGKFNWGTGTVTLDFKWYAPYKPTMDLIIAGFIWAYFLFNTWKRIPELIHGQGMLTHNVINIQSYEEKNNGN